MPQYTSNGTTSSGMRVTAVYDTEAATVTYTVTDDTGKSASSTVPESTPGNSSTLVKSLMADLGRQGSTMRPGNIASTMGSMDDEVHVQAAQANAAARATGTDVPANPTPPPPVPNADNPSPTPATTTESVQSSAPENPSTIDVNNGAIGLGVDTTTVAVDTAPQPDPNEYAAETNRLAAQNQAAADAAENANETARLNARGLAAKSSAQSTATNQDAVSFQKAKDWRVRLSLAPSAKYLYTADNPGILKPLAATNGVIFPYTPAVSVAYNAAYESSDLIHSNYKIYNYKNSSVDTVTITGEFTAQDTTEANYLLAVIHFFRSVTKMFYGRDENPRNGVPPPLCYLSGLGTFQFDNHPLVVTNFTYSLPTDVDYIRAGSMTNEPGNGTGQQTTPNNTDSASAARIQTSNLGPKLPNFQRQATTINSNATYVPTRMQITVTCTPIVTRNNISNTFSLKDYATGKLLQGSKQNGGGIW